MIDIHCHAEHGQQDALAVAKLASESGMYGILYKSIGKEDKRSAGPMDDVRQPPGGASSLVRRDRHRADQGLGRLRALS